MYEDKKKNIHAGHRERERQKYLRVGLDGFSEHEMLELLLFYAIAQCDTNELAHSLIDKFGSLDAVLSAPVEQLCSVKGIGTNSAILIRLISDLADYRKQSRNKRESLDTVEKIGEYLLPQFENVNTEQVVMVALDSRLRVIRCVKVCEGCFEKISLPLTSIVKTLMECNACAVIMAHNHPSGIPYPSTEDIKSNNVIKNAFASFNIQYVDHIIVCSGSYISMKNSHPQYF